MNPESVSRKSISVVEGGYNNRVERRRHTRYPLQIRTVFAWNGQGKNRNQESGFTRDISIDGLFVLSPLPLPLGTDVSLEISFPAIEPGTPGLRLTFDGVVIRVVKSSEDAGFAVTGIFQHYMSSIEM